VLFGKDFVQSVSEGIRHHVNLRLTDDKWCPNAENVPHLPGAARVKKHAFLDGMTNQALGNVLFLGETLKSFPVFHDFNTKEHAMTTNFSDQGVLAEPFFELCL
jgi:hypothetical protein